MWLGFAGCCGCLVSCFGVGGCGLVMVVCCGVVFLLVLFGVVYGCWGAVFACCCAASFSG